MRSKNIRRSLAAVLSTALVLMSFPQLAAAQTTGSEKRVRIAVLDFKLEGVAPEVGVLMIDRLRSDLVNTQRFIVLDRAQSDKIEAELARQQTGLTDTETSTRIGEQFNVARIVVGRVASVKSLGIIQVNVEMIDMRTAQIMISRTLTYEGQMRGFILNKVPEIVALLSTGKKPPVATAAPQPPQSLVAFEGPPGETSLSWRDVPDAQSYNVYFSTLPGVNRATANKIPGVVSPFRHSGLAESTTYYYIVTAENETGESPDSNEASATTMVAAAAPQPTPEPEPVQPEPSSGALKTWGITFVVIAGVAQLIAAATVSSAEDDAAAAQLSNDADAYQSALDDRDSAESLQNVAIGLGVLGGIFLIIHAATGGSSSTAMAPGPEGQVTGFGVDVKPRSVMAGYTVRW